MISFLFGSLHGRISFMRDCRMTGYSEVMYHYVICDVWLSKEEMEAEKEPEEELFMRYDF